MPIHMKKKKIDNVREELERRLEAHSKQSRGSFAWLIVHYVYYCVLMILLLLAMVATMCMDMVLTHTVHVATTAIKPVRFIKKVILTCVCLMCDFPYMMMYSIGNFLVGVLCVWLVIGHIMLKIVVAPAQSMFRQLLIFFGLPCIVRHLDSHNKSIEPSEISTEKDALDSKLLPSYSQVRKDATKTELRKDDGQKLGRRESEDVGSDKAHAE